MLTAHHEFKLKATQSELVGKNLNRNPCDLGAGTLAGDFTLKDTAAELDLEQADAWPTKKSKACPQASLESIGMSQCTHKKYMAFVRLLMANDPAIDFDTPLANDLVP